MKKKKTLSLKKKLKKRKVRVWGKKEFKKG